MKIFKILSILPIFILFSFSAMSENSSSIYDFNLIDIDGKNVSLSNFKGKPILLVNTASRCGFTPQYEGLQNLFIEYKDSDLTIIATTSNSFNQEYASTEDIKKICLVNYNIGFITSSPIEVRGKNSHEIYSWLKEKYNIAPKWNFFKYLFDRNGDLSESWSSMTKPNSNKIKSKIDSLI